MNLLLALSFAAATPEWAFVAESGPIPYLHVIHNGQDLGRCAQGTMYYNGTMTFVADEVFKGGFE